MRRVLLVDDERPVIDGISLIVRRDLSEEFEVVGSASSGREAVEKVGSLAPDIVLMDVRMPGLTGLEAIRELRSRGSTAVFILVTAYERFDIAQAAVGLGVLDYLLKPVAKDKLALSLRAAAAFLDRKAELERKEMEGQEATEHLRELAETALFHGIVLGADLAAELPLYRSTLGLGGLSCLVGVAVFHPRAASRDPGAEVAGLHERFRSFMRYKTSCLCGPLVRGRCAFLAPWKPEAGHDREGQDLLAAFRQAFGAEMDQGMLSFGLSSPVPLEEAPAGWREACLAVYGRNAAVPETAREEGPEEDGKPFEDEESFLEELLAGRPERARYHLERLLAGLEGPSPVRPSRFHALAGLFGAAARGLARRGLLSPEEAEGFQDAGDLEAAAGDGCLPEAARDRLAHLIERMARSAQYSAPVAGAVAFIQENFGKQIGLELAADAVGLTPGRLSRLFVEETGKGFSDYLIEYRIEKAREALREPGASIKNVSLACGYPDPNYFSRLFKKVTGLTPSSFSSASPELPGRDETS
jgi:two-component system response regulator YesN